MIENEQFWPGGYFAALTEFMASHAPGDPGLGELILRNVERAGAEVAAGPLADPAGYLTEQRSQMASFRVILEGRWGNALNLLELLVDHNRHVVEHIEERHRAEAFARQDSKFEALLRLQVRAGMVSQEVITLLRAGLATGAMARWRTLLELWTVSSILAASDQEISRRYLAHPAAEQLRANEEYEQVWEVLGWLPPEWTIEERLQSIAELKEEFGTGFTGHYGWAAPLFGGKSPRFAQLRDKAELQAFAGPFRDASHGTHANPTGVGWNLQGMDHSDDVINGPSDAGLAQPARCTLLTLCGMTTRLLSYELDELLDDDDPDPYAEAATLVQQQVAVQLARAAIDLFEDVAHQQEVQDLQLTALITDARSVLISSPGLTLAELAGRLNADSVTLEEALERGVARNSITGTVRYDAVGD